MRRGFIWPRIRACAGILAATAAVGAGVARGDGVPAPGSGPAQQESEREADGPVLYEWDLDAAGDPLVIVVHVIDETAATPVAGAAVSVHREAQHPLPGAVAAVATGTTDASGWARIAVAGKFVGEQPWIYVEAKGYAPNSGYGAAGTKDPIALRRGNDISVEVRDVFDRPVAGARVGVHLGCGHTPDVRDVVTDVEGRAVLAGVSPACATEVWVVAEGLESTYHDLTIAPAVEGPRPMRLLPAPPIEGRVIGLDGKPVAGAAVGTRAFHRGPWTRTDGEGRFRLFGSTGLPGNDELRVETTDPPVGRKPVPGASFPRPPFGVPVTVRVAPPPKDDEEEPPAPVAPPTTRVHVAVRAKGAREPAAGARIAVARNADGLCLAEDTDEEGEVTFDLPRGAWTIYAGTPAGDSTLEWAPATAPLLVAEDGPQLVRLEVERNPFAPVDLSALPGEVSVQVVTPTRVLSVAADAETPVRQVPLPLDEPSALRCFARGLVRVTPLPRARTPQAELTVKAAWFPTLHVKASFVGPDGAPAEARAVLVANETPKFEEAAPAREAAIEAPAEAGLRMVVEPSDPHLRRRVVLLPPPSDAEEVDLGLVRLEASAPAPLLLLADGSPAAGIDVAVTNEGRVFTGRTGEGGRVLDVDQDADGAIAPGAVLHAFPLTRGLHALHARLDPAAATWTLRWPGSSISWSVEAEEGGALPTAVVAIDGDRWALSDGETAVGGVPPGPHEVVVTAPGRRARIYSVVLKDGEERKIVARLRKP